MHYKAEGITNLRDLGGIRTKDGMVFKSGLLFRSGAIATSIPAGSVALIRSFCLNTIIDLRDSNRVKEDPDYDFGDITYINSPIFEIMNPETGVNPIDIKGVENSLVGLKHSVKEYRAIVNEFLSMYRSMPFSWGFKPVFEAMDGYERILYHCQGGKDRTGLMSIFILRALGVSKRRVIRDYLDSNKARRGRNRWRFGIIWRETHQLHAVHYMKKILLTNRKNLRVMFDAIDEKFGSFDNYLEKHFGITKERIANWKSFYLEPIK